MGSNAQTGFQNSEKYTPLKNAGDHKEKWHVWRITLEIALKYMIKTGRFI
jgi:hypothetical protein